MPALGSAPFSTSIRTISSEPWLAAAITALPAIRPVVSTPASTSARITAGLAFCATTSMA